MSPSNWQQPVGGGSFGFPLDPFFKTGGARTQLGTFYMPSSPKPTALPLHKMFSFKMYEFIFLTFHKKKTPLVDLKADQITFSII